MTNNNDYSNIRYMKFDIDKEQLKLLFELDSNHVCSLKDVSGTIGGKLSYQFTPTGLGVIVIVKCACGEEMDLTDYNKW